MKKFNYGNITGVHLELTTKCNAMCPMCNRNFKGKVRENLIQTELSLEDIKKIMPPEFVKQLKLISLCGVYGEPICNKDLKEIMKYFYSCNENIDLDLYTNGSLYDTSWWKELAQIMKNKNGSVIFGIDGIDQEVHSMHRCNTDYEKVLTNARSFIKAGGNAQWDYIVFKHNEDEVEEARKLSEKLGFKNFQIKKTSRFLKNLYEEDEKLDSTIAEYGKHPVYDKTGKIKYYLELPTKDEYKNKSEDLLFEMINKYGSMESYLDGNTIDCEALSSGGIFVSALGEVFPCCTVYQQVCYKTVHDVKDPSELNEYNLYKDDNVSGFEKSIEEIVNGSMFTSLVQNFDCESIEDGKPKSCSRACGKNLNLHKNGHTTDIKYRRD